MSTPHKTVGMAMEEQFGDLFYPTVDQNEAFLGQA